MLGLYLLIGAQEVKSVENLKRPVLRNEQKERKRMKESIKELKRNKEDYEEDEEEEEEENTDESLTIDYV